MSPTARSRWRGFQASAIEVRLVRQASCAETHRPFEWRLSSDAASSGDAIPRQGLSMDLQLKGKRALVTGSTAGIGFAIAASLAKEGARVIVNGRTQEGVDKAVAKIKAETGGDAVGFAGDLGRAPAAEALVRLHPKADILVNNLGIFEPKPFEEIPDADWLR